VRFERIAGDVHNLPLVNQWADAVFSCAAIHHSSRIDALFREIWRVLKPGGLLVFVSEPSKKASILARQPDNTETAHGINEHIYSFGEYMTALRAAGFRARQLSPRSVRYRFLYPDPEFREGLPPLFVRLGRSETGRRLMTSLLGNRVLGPLLYRFANLPLSVVARRPLS
jgi:SAM-dependent methyltransferase